jgi:hypothetical protein
MSSLASLSSIISNWARAAPSLFASNGGHSSFFFNPFDDFSILFWPLRRFLMKTFRPSIHPSATHKGQI